MSGIVNTGGARSGIINPPPSKTVPITRDSATASGTQAVTGVGFRPTTVFVIASESANECSIGWCDSSLGGESLMNDGGRVDNRWGVGFWNAYEIQLMTDSGSAYSGYISSYDSDGFTVTWVKYGSPTGTIAMRALCIR